MIKAENSPKFAKTPRNLPEKFQKTIKMPRMGGFANVFDDRGVLANLPHWPCLYSCICIIVVL